MLPVERLIDMNITIKMIEARLPDGFVLNSRHDAADKSSVSFARSFDIGADSFGSGILHVGRLSKFLALGQAAWPKNIICLMDDASNAEPPELVRSNILFVGEKTDSYETITLINKIILDFRRVSSLLTNAYLDGVSIPALTDMLMAEIGYPVRVLNSAMKILADSRKDTLGYPLTSEHGIGKYTTIQPFDQATFKEYRERIKRNGEPFRVDTHVEVPFFCFPIGHSGRTLGTVFVREHERQVDEAAIGITRFFVKLMAERMRDGRGLTGSGTLSHDDFIVGILEGSISGHEQIERCATQIDFLNNSYYYMQVFQIRANHHYFNLNIDSLKRQLSKNVNAVASVMYEGNIVTVHKVAQPGRFLAISADWLETFISEQHLLVGVSSYTSELMELPFLYQQACAAIEMGQKCVPSKSLYYFDDYKLDTLVRISSELPTIKYYLNGEVLTLERYDMENETELFLTLKTYLSNNLRQKTAKKMHIHRNTLVYRLNRITELTGLNLDDPDTVLHLMLTYKLLECM